MTLLPEIKIAQQRLSERSTRQDILPVQPPMQEFPGIEGWRDLLPGSGDR